MTFSFLQVLEETGFDIKNRICKDVFIEQKINDQLVRLYIIPGVSKDTKFYPKTRKEIRVGALFSFIFLEFCSRHKSHHPDDSFNAEHWMVSHWEVTMSPKRHDPQIQTRTCTKQVFYGHSIHQVGVRTHADILDFSFGYYLKKQ